MDNSTTTTRELRPLTIRQRNGLIGDLRNERVKKKPNTNLSYLESWDVIATLIKVFGFGGFSSELIESSILKAEQQAQVRDNSKMNWVITAKATVRLTIHQTGAVYTEAAIASSKQPDFGESADMAIKSAESDAVKRAARFLGTQFGLSLYDDGRETDVVEKVIAPGGECPPNPEELKAWNEFADRQDAIRAEMLEEQQRKGAAANPRLDTGPAEGVTPEQHQENLALVNKAVTSRRKKDQEQAEATPA